MTYLVTSGGTEEPLDGVRCITNFSTGRTGAGLAGFLAGRGERVILLHGRHAAVPDAAASEAARRAGGRLELVRYRTFSDLDAAIHAMLRSDLEIGAVIHLAAVSDYSPVSLHLPDGTVVEAGSSGKLSSSPEEVMIRLRRNHKIIARMRDYAAEAGRAIILVGFKLTNTPESTARKAAVFRLLDEAECDLVVLNDLSEIGYGSEDESPDRGSAAGSGSDDGRHDAVMHDAVIYDRRGRILRTVSGKAMLYRELYRIIQQLADAAPGRGGDL